MTPLLAKITCSRSWLWMGSPMATTPEIPGGGFQVLLVDCPWKYRNWSAKAHGAAASHYPGMEYEALRDVPVQDWAADDSMIFQWGTWPKADQAMDLLRDWGFNYVTGFPWVKVVPSSGEIRRGIGFWSQSASEFLLIGRRGKPKSEKLEKQVIGMLCGSERQFYAPIREHSQKPMAIQEYVEARFDGPFLELFAVRDQDGWGCWGHGTGWHVYPGGAGVMALEEAIMAGLVPDPAAPGRHNGAEGSHPDVGRHADGEDGTGAPPDGQVGVLAVPDPAIYDHLDAAIADF